MMTEISLNILDVVQNSIRAEASLIEIEVSADSQTDRLIVHIRDNGCGMDEKQLQSVTDPFFTTRTTRKIGLGIPFFKQAAEATEGCFEITSAPGKGTQVTAEFVLSSIDRMPLGDMPGTIHTLVTLNPQIDFIYRYVHDENEFTLDTRELREILGADIKFSSREVSAYIMDYLTENTSETDDGNII